MRAEAKMAAAKMSKIEAEVAELLAEPRLKPIGNRKVLLARVMGLGFAEVCGRCGGTGRYSFNQIDGDRCYGCSGTGERAPKVTAKLREEIREKVEAGELAAYADRLVEGAKAKREAARVYDTLRGLENATWWQRFHNGAGLEMRAHFSALAYSIHDEMERVIKWAVAQSDAMRDGRKLPAERQAVAEALAGRIEELKLRIRVIDELWIRVLFSGEHDAARVRLFAVKDGGNDYFAEREVWKADRERAEELIREAFELHGLAPMNG